MSTLSGRALGTRITSTLFNLQDVDKADLDRSVFRMASSRKHGEAAVKKSRSFASNAKAISTTDLKPFQRNKSHRHIPLIGSCEGPYQVYPEAFCEEICRTATKDREAEVSAPRLSQKPKRRMGNLTADLFMASDISHTMFTWLGFSSFEAPGDPKLCDILNAETGPKLSE